MESTTRLELYKETAGTLVWKEVSGDVQFRLYIPKWRIPVPVPHQILVRIGMKSSGVPCEVYKGGNPREATNPIQVVVGRVREVVNYVRFAPHGAKSDWEIGEPYIPLEILPCLNAQALYIEVQWF